MKSQSRDPRLEPGHFGAAILLPARHGQVSPTDGARGQAEGPRGREGGWPVAWGETPASGKQQSLGKQVLFGRLAVQEAETLAGTPGAVCAYLLPWRAALC